MTVELKMLPGEANAIASFLRSKIKSQITIRENDIRIDTEPADEVKLLIEKFLQRDGLDSYRVLSENGVIRVIAEDKQEASRTGVEDKIKGVPPFPPLSSERLPLMQTVYPNYGFVPNLPQNKKRKRN